MHNIAIFTADPGTNPNAKRLFLGDQFAGIATKTYSVKALAAGTYQFHCAVHPTQMSGTFIVGWLYLTFD